MERQDAIVAEYTGIGAIEDKKPHTIEAHQAARSANPEIAVRSLRDRLNAVLRETIGYAPDAVAVLAREGGGRRRTKVARVACGSKNKPKKQAPDWESHAYTGFGARATTQPH